MRNTALTEGDFLPSPLMLKALKYLLLTPFKPAQSLIRFRDEKHFFTLTQWMILVLVFVFAVDMGAHFDSEYRMTTNEWIAFYAGRAVRLVLIFVLKTYIVAVVLQRNGFKEVSFRGTLPYVLMIGLPIYATIWDAHWYFRPDGYGVYFKWVVSFWSLFLLTKVIQHLAPVSEWKSWAIAFGVLIIDFLWHSPFWGMYL